MRFVKELLTSGEDKHTPFLYNTSISFKKSIFFKDSGREFKILWIMKQDHKADPHTIG